MDGERRDDWRQGVDQNLASLNAGQRVWERDLTAIKKGLADIDKLLRGDPEKDTDGLMARLHLQENDTQLLKAVVLKDKAGNKGLAGRVEALETGERTSDNRWKFATAVAVAIISMAGLLATNWDRIESWMSRRQKDPVEQMIESAKHPKSRRRHVIIQQQPEDPIED